ncbi:MAG: nitroreductase/quinone reductase family protein [SAR202 cluster bacterium]|jgi:deazaflavin-dependent oxidoreductase (nitroreductase family)|nr:nitroreductase/quinone reductase family protein [SAR202 cluster bacterium]MDP6511993.1 nitroreductase/quinone reductase family protein [SAR202 cluster bacterium]MDP6713688.1 nitroreductase/quinone reductase family protein [SAR202 cluster bacterium]
MQNLEPEIRDALTIDMVVDITTTGRKTGQPRRIEIWAHNLDGRLFLTASPGRRSWYANLVATRKMTLHLKDKVKADLAASVRPILDDDERRDVLTRLNAASAFRQTQNMDVEQWVQNSCLVELTVE